LSTSLKLFVLTDLSWTCSSFCRL